MEINWTLPELRAAAVEYTLRECGPRRSDAGWTAAVQKCAEACGVPDWRDLARWCADRALRPECAESYAGGKKDGVADVDAAALQAPDFLGGLLQEEDGVLSEGERAEFARLLEQGVKLTAGQRAALAVALRGSVLATRREVVRGVLDFVATLSGEDPEAVGWEVQETRYRLLPGEICSRVPLTATVPRYGVLGRFALRIGPADGPARVFLPFAAARGRVVGNVVPLRRLIPRRVLNESLLARRFTLLRSLVCPDGRSQTGWAQLFGETKQNVSHASKLIAAEIQERTGSKAGFRTLRSKPQRNKGRAKV